MFFRHAILVFVATGMLAAADITPKLTPPALDKLSQDQFQKLLFRAPDAPPPPEIALELGGLKKSEGSCAIPLLEFKVEHPERFSMPHMPIVGGGLVDPIGVAPPMAACPHWNTDK